MVDRTPEIATLLRQKPAAEGPIQGIGRHKRPRRRSMSAWRHCGAIGTLCVNAWLHFCPIRRRLRQHHDHWSCGAQ
jgi:hypothetical protein